MKKQIIISIISAALTFPYVVMAEPHHESEAQPNPISADEVNKQSAKRIYNKEPLAAEVAQESKQARNLGEALFDGQFDFTARYRYQFLDVAGFADNAHASTLLTLFKYETKPLYGVSFLGEVRSVQRVGSTGLYNDTINGVTSRPTIADPDILDINQGFLRFADIIPDTEITIGRRNISLNNQRFISSLPFRQNFNSFDGIVVENRSLENTYFHYSYANNFNRAFTDDSNVGNFDEADFHLIHAEHEYAKWLKLAAYGYILGIEEASFTGASNLATNTFGLNAKGSHDLGEGWGLHYDVEYAHQHDNSENTRDIDLNYYRIQPGVSYGPFRANLGLEVLEGDGTSGFSTPLALLHAYNGLADVFLVTPANGLEDRYINATYNLKDSGVMIGDYDVFGNTSFQIAYHDFQAENNGTDYGTEFDVLIKKKLRSDLTLVLEYANYNADAVFAPGAAIFNRDVEQFWSMLVFKY